MIFWTFAARNENVLFALEILDLIQRNCVILLFFFLKPCKINEIYKEVFVKLIVSLKKEEKWRNAYLVEFKNKITLRIRFPTSWIVKTWRGRGGGQDGVFAHSVLHLILAYKLVAPSEGHSRFDLCTKYALLANQPPFNHPGRATQLLVAENYPPLYSCLKPSPFVLPPLHRASAPRTLFLPILFHKILFSHPKFRDS